MSSLEQNQPGERRRQLFMEFNDLVRRMMLEGAVDPKAGTQFALIQIDGEMDPFRPLSAIADMGTLVVSVGMQDPVTAGFENIVSRLNDTKEGE